MKARLTAGNKGVPDGIREGCDGGSSSGNIEGVTDSTAEVVEGVEEVDLLISISSCAERLL